MINSSEDNENRLTRIERLVESNAKAIEANSAGIADNRQQINVLTEALGRTLGAIDNLRDIVEDSRVDFDEYRSRNDTTIASMNAAVERLEAIVTQLGRERS